MAAVVGAGLAAGLDAVGAEELLNIDTDRMYAERTSQIPQAWRRMRQDAAVIGAAAVRLLTGTARDGHAVPGSPAGRVPAAPAGPDVGPPPAASPPAVDGASAADKGASLQAPVGEPARPVPAADKHTTTAPPAPVPSMVADASGDRDSSPFDNGASLAVTPGWIEQGADPSGLAGLLDNGPGPPPRALDPGSGVEVEVAEDGVPAGTASIAGGGDGGRSALDASVPVTPT
jgi:hypothetical protein